MSIAFDSFLCLILLTHTITNILPGQSQMLLCFNPFFFVNVFYNHSWYSLWHSLLSHSPVGKESRIHWLHLCLGIRSPNGVLDITQNIWWWGSGNTWALIMRTVHSLLSLLSPLWPGLLAPDRGISICQTELFEIWPECKKCLALNGIVCDRTVCK